MEENRHKRLVVIFAIIFVCFITAGLILQILKISGSGYLTFAGAIIYSGGFILLTWHEKVRWVYVGLLIVVIVCMIWY
jgi:hypothetical protein